MLDFNNIFNQKYFTVIFSGKYFIQTGQTRAAKFRAQEFSGFPQISKCLAKHWMNFAQIRPFFLRRNLTVRVRPF
jgi:hypothetical protein